MLNFPEKLPNADAYVFMNDNNVFLRIENVPDKEIFTFHELVMLWNWNNDQLVKYFSTRKIIEGIMKC